MPPNLDLSLVPTEELIVALSNRFQAAAFTGVDFDGEVCVYLHGSGLLCSGLLTNAQNELMWATFQGTPE